MSKTLAFPAAIALLIIPALAAQDGIIVKVDEKVTLRDGVRLSTNLFLPAAPGKYPTVLVRTPYGKGDGRNGGARAHARAGYAHVVQDTRGRGPSEGTFDPFMTEADDGADTVAWILAQPWSDGKVGMSGGSYVGFVQWQAASREPPGLVAICPAVTFSDFHDDVAYPGGAFQVSLGLGWGAMVSMPPGANDIAKDWPAILRILPLADYPRLLGRRIAFYDRWLDHPADGPFWKPASVKDAYPRMKVRALNLGNWYDIFSLATAENFRRMREEGPTEEIRRGQRLILGAGAHGAPSRKLGERDFGDAAAIDVGALERRWLDRWLKGVENGAESDPPVKIFVMGANRWRDEDEWPPARARHVPWYLHSNGGANTLSGDGVLGTAAPGDERPDTFRYDPADPVPTTGGANLLFIPSGPFDQRKVEARRDVLVYTSEPLEEPLEVTGPVRLKLFAATSAADTDFTAKLVDVCPDGTAWNLADGIIRARYRETDAEARPVEPGKVHEYLIDLWVTSNLFLEGHRIRLEVSSSNFPRFDRNPNTGKPFAVDGGIVVAEQTVHHSASRPSHLILPVVPPKDAGEGTRRVEAPRPGGTATGSSAPGN